MSAVNFGPPASIAASDGRDKGYETFLITYSPRAASCSRATAAGVTVGADIVKKLNARLGGTVKIRDEEVRRSSASWTRR